MPPITVTIRSNGEVMDPAYQATALDIRREVGKIPQAELRLFDGDAAEGEFPISDTSFFEPGAEIEILLRYEGELADTTVFKGVVVRHGIEMSGDDTYLIVGMKDAAVALTGARTSAVYRNKSDDEIIKDLIAKAGLVAGKIPATKPKHKEMVQYDCTPWDFILSRADALGLLVVAEDGKLSLAEMAPAGSASKDLTFKFGANELYDLDIEADATYQPAEVASFGWDPKALKPTALSKAKSTSPKQGNLDGGKLAKKLSLGNATLGHGVPLQPDELESWASGRMARSRMALLRGRIAVRGIGAIKLLDPMELSGVGKRFTGTTMVTGLRHILDSQGWRTDIQFGLSPEEYSRKPDILAPPAAGLLPAARGLQIGVVADFLEDKDENLRVQVKLPGIDSDMKEAVWARLAAPDAGKGRGFYFRPEKDDEVLVGFLNEDPRYPVILGALFGSKNTPPETVAKPTAKNEKRGIVTKKGTSIGFIDGDKVSVYIETPAKNKLLIDDGEKQICLTDQHGNSITMSKDGITLKSAGKFVIDSAKEVEIKGSKVDIK